VNKWAGVVQFLVYNLAVVAMFAINSYRFGHPAPLREGQLG
jgi:hypothetical protein